MRKNSKYRDCQDTPLVRLSPPIFTSPKQGSIRVLSRGQVRGLGKRRWGQGEGGHQGDDESKSYSLRVEEEGRREVAKVSGERVCGDLAPRKNRVFPHSRQSLGNTVPPPVRVAETVLSLLRGVHSTL